LDSLGHLDLLIQLVAELVTAGVLRAIALLPLGLNELQIAKT
jgi:hypothetical protein